MARRLPPLSALRPFEAAARLESFSQAAAELHLTHGAVSHQVRALEEHLGTPLFARHGKRVTLTAAGRTFAERVRASLDELSAAAEALRARREDRLTLSVLPSFASRWLMPRLIRFMDAHPKVEVNVIASTALADFRNDEIDVAIRFGPGPWPPHDCEMFMEDEYFVVASPKLAAAAKLRTRATCSRRASSARTATTGASGSTRWASRSRKPRPRAGRSSTTRPTRCRPPPAARGSRSPAARS